MFRRWVSLNFTPRENGYNTSVSTGSFCMYASVLLQNDNSERVFYMLYLKYVVNYTPILKVG